MPNLIIHRGQDWLELSIITTSHGEVLAWNITYLHRHVLSLKRIGDWGNLGSYLRAHSWRGVSDIFGEGPLSGLIDLLLRELSYIRWIFEEGGGI